MRNIFLRIHIRSGISTFCSSRLSYKWRLQSKFQVSENIPRDIKQLSAKRQYIQALCIPNIIYHLKKIRNWLRIRHKKRVNRLTLPKAVSCTRFLCGIFTSTWLRPDIWNTGFAVSLRSLVVSSPHGWLVSPAWIEGTLDTGAGGSMILVVGGLVLSCYLLRMIIFYYDSQYVGCFVDAPVSQNSLRTGSNNITNFVEFGGVVNSSVSPKSPLTSSPYHGTQNQPIRKNNTGNWNEDKNTNNRYFVNNSLEWNVDKVLG